MKYKKILTLISVLSLSACDIGTSPEIKELRRLCALDAGQKVYETVEADGYFHANEDGDGIAAMLVTAHDTSKFQYVEFCKDKPIDPFRDNVKLEPGCYRAEKVKRSNGNCNADIDKHFKKHKYAYDEFSKEQCIAIDKIEKPISQYRAEGNSKVWVDQKNNIEYGRYEGRLVDSQTEKVLATEISYTAFKRPDPSFGCGSPKVTGLEKNIMPQESIISLTIKQAVK